MKYSQRSAYQRSVKMGRERKLDAAEIHTILKLNEERSSVAKIAETVSGSRKVDVNLLKDNYGKGQSCGRLQCPTGRDKFQDQIRA